METQGPEVIIVPQNLLAEASTLPLDFQLCVNWKPVWVVVSVLASKSRKHSSREQDQE